MSECALGQANPFDEIKNDCPLLLQRAVGLSGMMENVSYSALAAAASMIASIIVVCTNVLLER